MLPVTVLDGVRPRTDHINRMLPGAMRKKEGKNQDKGGRVEHDDEDRYRTRSFEADISKRERDIEQESKRRDGNRERKGVRDSGSGKARMRRILANARPVQRCATKQDEGRKTNDQEEMIRPLAQREAMMCSAAPAGQRGT